MTEELKMRIVAFVRSIANLCDNCFHRGERCDDCFSSRARSLMRQIDTDETVPVVDDSLSARIATIRNILAASGRPLLAREINLHGICSPQLKFWTLNEMVARRMIGRKTASNKNAKGAKKMLSYYYLLTKETK